MSEKMLMGVIVYGMAIAAGAAVSFGWYGLATALGLSALLLASEAAAVHIVRALAELLGSRGD